MGKRRKSEEESGDHDEQHTKPIIKAEDVKAVKASPNGSNSPGSDSNKPVKKVTITTKTNDDSSSSSSDEDGDDGDWNKKNKKKRSGKNGNKSGKKLKKEEDVEREEGEVDDDEDPEDPFDPEDDDEEEEFNDGYDENLMGDEDDQAKLAAMTEKEREQELFNRSEKREVLKTRFEIQRKLRQQQKADRRRQQLNNSNNKNTRDSSAAAANSMTTLSNILDPKEFSESSLRSTERRRNLEDKNNKKDALKMMKEMREKKKLKQQKLKTKDVYSSSSDSDDSDIDEKPGVGGRKGRDSSSSSSSSSSSDDSDNDSRKKDRKRRDRRKGSSGSDREGSDEEDKTPFQISVEVLNSIRLSRDQLERWVHSPFFTETVKGAFVKMGIGARQSSDGSEKSAYRAVQVTEVYETPKVYELRGAKSMTKTNKLLKVRYANDERSFRMEYTSNSEFTADEFKMWMDQIQDQKVEHFIPTRQQVEAKKRDIAFASNYRYTDSDIQLMVQEKEKFNKNPKNYAMRKTQLMKMKEHAEQAGNDADVERLQTELDELEERAKVLDQKRTHSIASISYLNEKNRVRNIAEAEKAILEESAKEAASKTDDPFKRRACAPQLYGSRKKVKDEPIEAASNGVDSVDSKAGILNGSTLVDSKEGILKPSLSSTPAASYPLSDDLFDAHDFDIQIDFDIGAGGGSNPVGPVSVSAFSSLNVSSHSNSSTDVKPITGNRRSLNLEEYKKKKGLI